MQGAGGGIRQLREGQGLLRCVGVQTRSQSAQRVLTSIVSASTGSCSALPFSCTFYCALVESLPDGGSVVRTWLKGLIFMNLSVAQYQ